MTATPPGSKMWRTSSRMLSRRCCRGAIARTKGQRCGPANTNLHTTRARNAITDRIAGAIDIPPWRKWTTISIRFGPKPTKSHTASRVVSGAASARLAACDGMNHQNFVLLARDFLDAFAGRHVKWLRAGLGFISGNHLVHFFHVSGCRIVFKKRLITVGCKCQNFGSLKVILHRFSELSRQLFRTHDSERPGPHSHRPSSTAKNIVVRFSRWYARRKYIRQRKTVLKSQMGQ